MAKKERKPPSKPSNAYLISFGDTMTAMLAFFIVLNSLAEDQTGANLHSGTGSFVSAFNSLGLPGKFTGDNEKRVQQYKESAPKYVVNDDDKDPDGPGNGPDEEGNDLRVLDRELENLQRMMVEFEQQFETKGEMSETSTIVFDLFDPLGKSGTLLPPDARKVLLRSMGVLLRPGYRLELNLWASTPGTKAMARMTEQAFQLSEEIRTEFPMLNKHDGAIRATANMWAFADDRRPIMSIIVVKADPKK